MTPFFRRIRRKLANDNQFLKYSRYAIGEIVLVVVGILIALYINNWNEQQKEREKFDQVLAEVEAELIGNINSCRGMLHNYLFRKDSIANMILFDELTYDDYRNNSSLGAILQYHTQPNIATDAFDKLLELNALLSPIQDSIRTRLKHLYRIKPEIYKGGDRVSELKRQNRKNYKKFSWYNDWILEIPNEDRISYLVDNPSYKKDIGEFILEEMQSLRPDVEYFDIRGRQLYNYIFDYLEFNMIKHDDSLYFQYDVEDYKHYVGTYIETNRSSSRMVKVDSLKIFKEDDTFHITYYFENTGIRREIIPVSKYHFRNERRTGFHRLIFNDQGKVIEQVWSSGLNRRKFKKIQ